MWNRGLLDEPLSIVAPAIFAVLGHHWAYSVSREKYNLLVNQTDDEGQPQPEPQFAQAANLCSDMGEFPLECAHILKVADCFEAATECRHYLGDKKPLTKKEVYSQIILKSGVEFDPKIVKTLKKVLTKDGTLAQG